MKIILAVCVTIFALTAPAKTIIKFIEPVQLYEVSTLPPLILARFSIACNQNFLKIVRHEIDIPTLASGKVLISIGGLVSENVSKTCTTSEEITVNAGHSFSGRDYELQNISKK
jgi:hypothetical protein